MIAGTAVVRDLPQQDLSNELKSFISGTRKFSRHNSLELTKTALVLLKKLPACRGAVFEYFCKVFDAAASNYIESIEVRVQLGKPQFLMVVVSMFRRKLKREKCPSLLKPMS